MSKLSSAGAPVTKEEAHNYIKAHVSLKSKLKENLSKPDSTVTPEVKAHFSSEINAFLFDIDQIKKLLETKDKNGELPQYLMVSLGANYHEESSDLHKPTVVLAGVSYQEEKDNYYTMSLTNPGLQQSPPLTLNGFPAPKS